MSILICRWAGISILISEVCTWIHRHWKLPEYFYSRESLVLLFCQSSEREILHNQAAGVGSVDATYRDHHFIFQAFYTDTKASITFLLTSEACITIL